MNLKFCLNLLAWQLAVFLGTSWGVAGILGIPQTTVSETPAPIPTLTDSDCTCEEPDATDNPLALDEVGTSADQVFNALSTDPNFDCAVSDELTPSAPLSTYAKSNLSGRHGKGGRRRRCKKAKPAKTSTCSWYKANGNCTKNGDPYTGRQMTCAVNQSEYPNFKNHCIKITNKSTGKSVIVYVDDSGSNVSVGGCDASPCAFMKLCGDMDAGRIDVSRQDLGPADMSQPIGHRCDRYR